LVGGDSLVEANDMAFQRVYVVSLCKGKSNIGKGCGFGVDVLDNVILKRFVLGNLDFWKVSSELLREKKKRKSTYNSLRISNERLGGRSELRWSLRRFCEFGHGGQWLLIQWQFWTLNLEDGT
jgi:hypothetical protein